MLSIFDIMAIPSLYEGVPLTVFEALAPAKAIVSTGVDGLGEVLKDGETALLVPPADSEALAAGIGRLLADPDRAAALRRRCEVERTRFEVQSAVDQMQSLYERLAANPRGAPI
jgi:glycosyltransferase involved in cell wall biosynthesis